MEKHNTFVSPGVEAPGRRRAEREARQQSPPAQGRQSEAGFDESPSEPSDLIDRLIPIDARVRPREYKQGRRVAQATLFLMTCTALFAIMDLLRNIPDFLLFGLAAGVLAGPVILAVLRYSGSPRLAGHLLCIVAFAVLFYQALMDTGLTNPAVAPMLLLPWAASYMLGATAALLYAGLAAGLFLVLYALHVQGYAFPFVAASDDVHIYLFTIYLIMVAVVAGIGYAYERYRKNALTERRRRIAADKKADARGSQGLRPEVLSRLAQDLRIPLLDIIGLGATLESKDGPTADYGELIAQEGRQAVEMLHAADELAWLAQADTQPIWEQIEITTEVERALAPLREAARQKDVTLWVESGSRSQPVKADRRMMNRLITRLTKFSIAHTRQGRITVMVDLDESLRVRVKTAGAHETTPLAQPTLASRAPGHPAASLDLAIAEQLAMKMNGRLEVNYAPESGSVFSVLLPLSS